ncbi:MAG: Spo0E family sporulation regulatory protein-aspartic acid phosphatase [Clostridia bacterium]
MKHQRQVLRRQIEAIQNQLNEIIEIQGPSSKEVLKVSKKLDRLIVLYLRAEPYFMERNIS